MKFKPVNGYVNDLLVFSFLKLTTAEKELRIKGISQCCNRKRNSAGKFEGIPIVWRYASDEDQT